IPALSDVTKVDRIFDRAVVFMRMRASGELTVRCKRSKLRKETLHFFRHDIPKTVLPDSRRIDDTATARKAQQLGGRSRVSALVRRFTDICHFQMKTGLQRIE